MASEQRKQGIETASETALLKEDLPRHLWEIVNDSSAVEGRNQLKWWMSRHNVFEAFRLAIDTFGQKGDLGYFFDRTDWFLSEAFLEELEIGEDSQETRLFQAKLITSPIAKGPAIHIYARDGGIPSYGVFLPFTENGKIDVSRSISGSHFAADGLHSFSPPRQPVIPKDGPKLEFENQTFLHSPEETASVIVYATRLAAAQLVSYLEKYELSLPKPAEEENTAITV